eukprot:4874927-Pyramimonas_sp.AAC.1
MEAEDDRQEDTEVCSSSVWYVYDGNAVHVILNSPVLKRYISIFQEDIVSLSMVWTSAVARGWLRLTMQKRERELHQALVPIVANKYEYDTQALSGGRGKCRLQRK